MEKAQSKLDQKGAKGITFSGTQFVVPETHDMLKTLLAPSLKKSYCERIILLILASNILVFWFIKNNSIRIKVFIGLYIFWRLSYNFGIGYLLYLQSTNQRIVSWVKSRRALSDETLLGKFCRGEIKTQMGPTYEIDKYPVEFNSWLLFRKIVDLILMLDFTAFICLVICCAIDNDYCFINMKQQLPWIVWSRLIVGTILLLFNLWVKVNAHNIIKDYAWYWGDFFFRQINNEELIFDGVFEMVPHPMYSVGYVGYYGLALIAKSYTVLTISIFGHFLQMIFLHYIENPHIDKIYGPSGSETESAKLLKLKDLKNFDNLKPLVGLCNIRLLRASDIINLLLVLTYTFVFPMFAYTITNPSKAFINPATVLFVLTVLIKIFESLFIDVLLILQGYYKTFTKWCLSNNVPIEKSLNNWSILYNSVISLTYSSYFGLNLYYLMIGLKQEDLYIKDWFYLRVFLCVSLIFTQIWINASIIDLIGYFGWFYGDFFIPMSNQRAHLTKAGIYRYLNNPEQFFGACGVIGVTLLIPNKENLICCLLWVVNNFSRINFIEKPHMIKIYGENEVLVDSGVTKTFKKHLVPEIIKRRVSGNFDSTPVNGLPSRRNSLISSAVDSLDNFIKELRNSNYQLSKQNILELSQELYFENSDYHVRIKNLESAEEGALKFVYLGTPIKIEWDSPAVHSSTDWIGLYKISQTSYSCYRTLVSSLGRWIWAKDEEGSAVFDKERLFWEEGIYEFRYHLKGKHDVAFITEPFEIKAKKIEVPLSPEAAVDFANELKTNVFDKVINNLDSIDAPISQAVKSSGNILQSYERLSLFITAETGIKLNSKIFLYSDNDEDLSVYKLSKKIIKMRKVLDDLSYNETSPKTIKQT